MTSLNHVSICANDLQTSVAFYREMFGLEELPTPNFGFPVRWLRAGDLQVHLFERPQPIPAYQHLAFTVEAFEPVYRRARERGILDDVTFGHHLYELPGGIVQLYLRDPSGNLVEVDFPNVNQVDRALIASIRPLPHPQNAENLRSTLFLPHHESSPRVAP